MHTGAMCALLLAWPSSSQVLDTIYSLGLSVPLVFHVDSDGFLSSKSQKVFPFFWAWWVGLQGSITTSVDRLRSWLHVGS